MKPIRIFISSVQKEFAVSDGFLATIRRPPGEPQAGRIAPSARRGEVTGEVTGEVAKLLFVCRGAMTRRQLQETLLLKGELAQGREEPAKKSETRKDKP